MIRLIGIDPGLVTGLVNTTFDENGLVIFEPYQMDYLALGDYVSSIRNSEASQPFVICENFTITQATAAKSQAPYSLESIGVVRYFCDKNGIKLLFQKPSDVMRLVTDAVLKRAGMYTPGKGHSNDAARHVLAYAMLDLGIMKEVLKGG